MAYARGDWFGELALLTKAPRSATVAVATRARLLKLGYEAFEPYVSAVCDTHVTKALSQSNKQKQ